MGVFVSDNQPWGYRALLASGTPSFYGHRIGRQWHRCSVVDLDTASRGLIYLVSLASIIPPEAIR